MSINQYADGYYIQCDFCDNSEGPYDAWDDAVYCKKEIGWRSVKDKHNNWADKCPQCLKDEASNSFECYFE
jgi:hypothetical protein